MGVLIAVGIGTALADDPLLTVRDVPGSSPQRVVFDSHLRLPPDSQLAGTAREVPTIVITTTAAPADAAATLATRGVIVLRAASDEQGRVELADGLALLAARGIRSLLIEGGATLAGRVLAERLVDELHLFVAPIVLGAGAHPGFAAWPGPDHLAEARRAAPATRPLTPGASSGPPRRSTTDRAGSWDTSCGWTARVVPRSRRA